MAKNTGYWDEKLFKRSVGILVRNARTERGWSQKKLAQATGVTVSMISQVETGITLPSLYLWTAMYDALDYRVLTTPKRDLPIRGPVGEMN